jgi:hypothetical protein
MRKEPNLAFVHERPHADSVIQLGLVHPELHGLRIAKRAGRSTACAPASPSMERRLAGARALLTRQILMVMESIRENVCRRATLSLPI